MTRTFVVMNALENDPRAPQVRALLDAAYPDGAPGELDTYYARHGQPTATVLVQEGDLVLGHLAVYVRGVKLGEQSLHIGLVGELAIAAERRRQGLARELIAHAHDYLRERAIPFAVLFAFEPAVYVSSGYRPMLNETRSLEPDGRWRTFVYRGGMVAELTSLTWPGLPLDLCGTAV